MAIIAANNTCYSKNQQITPKFVDEVDLFSIWLPPSLISLMGYNKDWAVAVIMSRNPRRWTHCSLLNNNNKKVAHRINLSFGYLLRKLTL